LLAALERLRFHELTRRTPVRILVPANVRRLAIACRALPEPLSAWLEPGAAFERSAPEGDADPTAAALRETDAFVAALAAALERERVPYAFTHTSSLDEALRDGAWVIVISPGALDAGLVASFGERVLASGRVSLGPRAPERDALMRPSENRLPSLSHPVVPTLLPREPVALADAIERTLRDLAVERLPASPEAVRTTLHHDSDGRPRALFVVNDSDSDVEAVAAAPGARTAVDALTLEPYALSGGSVTVRLRARNVVMLELA
jgi:hypothetical protein